MIILCAPKDNLLFADERRSTLKLCDFGLAVASKSKTLSGWDPMHPMLETSSAGRFGTMPFMSPEMAAASGHSFSAFAHLSPETCAQALTFGPWGQRDLANHADLRDVLGSTCSSLATCPTAEGPKVARSSASSGPPKMCREQLKRAIIIGWAERLGRWVCQGHPFGPTFEPAAEAIAKRPSKLTALG